MRVVVDKARVGEFVFSVAPGVNDCSDKFVPGEFFFKLAEDWSVAATHPDVIALAVITSVHPFVADALDLNIAVSESFAEACKKWLPYECRFEDVRSNIVRRAKGNVPALSFSGGVDSTAALALMPDNTRLYFLDRFNVDRSEPKGLYDKHSAYVACDMAASLGYSVTKVPTSIESIRAPVGFSIDWTSGVPALLMADYDDLSSISWGVVAESGFRVGHEKFIDFSKRTIYRRWNELLKAVGLCLGAPVAGLSEVGTSTIAQASSLKGMAQSCIRGPKGVPCHKCFKCFRKTLIDAGLDGRQVPAELFDRLIKFGGWEKIVLGIPVKHENVFSWAVRRLDVGSGSKYWPVFKGRILADNETASWADKWYPMSADLIPEEFRESAIEKIKSFVAVQTPEDVADFVNWDISHLSSWDGFEDFKSKMMA